MVRFGIVLNCLETCRKPYATLKTLPQAAGGQNAGLAARLAARPSAPESATAPYPGVTATLTEAVLHPDNAAHMADMAYHTHASPWLQALVKANSGNRCATK